MRHRLELRPLGPSPSHPSYSTLARVYLGDALWLSPIVPYLLLHCALASRERLQANPPWHPSPFAACGEGNFGYVLKCEQSVLYNTPAPVPER